MANEENLRPLNELCKEDAKKIQSKGGKARAEAIKKRKTFKELLEIALQLPNVETGEQNDIAIVNSLIDKAIKGDVKAIEVVRDTVGEKPKDVVENVNPPTINIGDVKI